jgi:F-type H+-transporting ATPase subunit gamma
MFANNKLWKNSSGTIYISQNYNNFPNLAISLNSGNYKGSTFGPIINQFKNAATQLPTAEAFLPIPTLVKKGNKKKTDFIFEPHKETLVAALMPKILNTQLFKAVLDANASEHGARMTAMDKASENANELLKSLKISYNRARQAAITTELTEIVSGAAALNG